MSALEPLLEPATSDAPADVICSESVVVCLWNLYNSESYSGPLSDKLIVKLVQMLVTGSWETRFVLDMIFDEILKDGSGCVLDAAVAAGFVPGVMRMLKAIRESAFPVGDPPRYVCSSVSQLAPEEHERAKGRWMSECEDVLLLCAVQIVSKEAYAMQAINCGLFAEMRSWSRSSAERSCEAIARVSLALFRFPQAVRRMQDEGLMPALLLELLESAHPDAGEAVTDLVGCLVEWPGSRYHDGCASSYYQRVIEEMKARRGGEKLAQFLTECLEQWKRMDGSDMHSATAETDGSLKSFAPVSAHGQPMTRYEWLCPLLKTTMPVFLPARLHHVNGWMRVSSVKAPLLVIGK